MDLSSLLGGCLSACVQVLKQRTRWMMMILCAHYSNLKQKFTLRPNHQRLTMAHKMIRLPLTLFASFTTLAPVTATGATNTIHNPPPGMLTRHFASVPDRIEESTSKPFPRWLRFSANAPVESRFENTAQVVSSISKSDGFLSNSNLLSDLATSLVMEDVEPHKLGDFYQALREIDGLRLHPDSIELFQECCEAVKNNNNKVPDTVAGVFHQITWSGSQGKLTHQIVTDG
jgi:hypothetical protein